MSDTLNAVRRHYAPTGLVERLQAALAPFGPEDRALLPQQLATLDQFHTRGLAATAELAALVGLTADMAVLDIGSGIGGPARYLAASYGCRVTGVDLSEPFVEAARYLTMRTGQASEVRFEVGSALDLPLPTAGFDVVLLQHVAMNVGERGALYQEAHRVLRPGGTFATFDIVRGNGEPHYPLPWAQSPATSFLLSAPETCEAIETAGFEAVEIRDDTTAAKAWASELQAAVAASPLNLGLVMGPGFAAVSGNMARSLLEGRIGVLMAVYRTAARKAGTA